MYPDNGNLNSSSLYPPQSDPNWIRCFRASFTVTRNGLEMELTWHKGKTEDAESKARERKQHGKCWRETHAFLEGEGDPVEGHHLTASWLVFWLLGVWCNRSSVKKKKIKLKAGLSLTIIVKSDLLLPSIKSFPSSMWQFITHKPTYITTQCLSHHNH